LRQSSSYPNLGVREGRGGKEARGKKGEILKWGKKNERHSVGDLKNVEGKGHLKKRTKTTVTVRRRLLLGKEKTNKKEDREGKKRQLVVGI